MDKLVSDAEHYIVDNREHLDRAAARLLEPKWAGQKAQEWAGLQWSRAPRRLDQPGDCCCGCIISP